MAAACELIHDQLGLSARSIVISTVGETPPPDDGSIPLLGMPRDGASWDICPVYNRPLVHSSAHSPPLSLLRSLSGVPNAIHKLAHKDLKATLAVSIHAPNQALRESIIPSAKAYPLPALMQVSRYDV